MTIAKGSQWGNDGTVPADVVVCSSDADAASAVDAVVALTAGDLHRGLGEPRLKGPGDECRLVPVDALNVTVEMVDGTNVTMRAVAHVCVGRFGAREGFRAVVNAGFVAGANLAPRCHPGDGRAELVTMAPNVSWRQRRMARRRAATGTHVPHPAIDVASVVEWSAEVDGGDVRVDGRVVSGAVRVTVVLLPGCVTVAV